MCTQRARENLNNANIFIDERRDTMRDKTKSCLGECICTSSKVEAPWFRLIQTCPYLGAHTKILTAIFNMVGIYMCDICKGRPIGIELHLARQIIDVVCYMISLCKPSLVFIPTHKCMHYNEGRCNRG